jgi:DNA-directed RNA polymerase subunit RPC12/RpoP
MAVIQCPHCSLKVELDDGISGLLDCPHCGEEFEWEEMNQEFDWTRANSVAWVLLVAITLFLILFSDSVFMLMV